MKKSKNTITRLSSVFPAGGSSNLHAVKSYSIDFNTLSAAILLQQSHSFTSLLQDGGEPKLVLSPKMLSIHKTLPCDYVFVHCSYLLPSQPKV